MLVALERFGVAHCAELPAKVLSQGQRRRVALSRLALSPAAPLWILDEPFSALDVAAVVELERLLASHLASGGMVVLTTHQEVQVVAQCGTAHRPRSAYRGVARRMIRALGLGAVGAICCWHCGAAAMWSTRWCSFVIVVSLFPLGVGPEPNMLRKMAPGVLWVAALLASMLSLARLFAPDHQDGTLEQMLLAGEPLVGAGAGQSDLALAGVGTAAGADRAAAGPAVRPARPMRLRCCACRCCSARRC